MSNTGQGIASATPTHERTYQHLNRACTPCRLQKVRCLSDSTSPTAQCQRCAKANRECVFAPPQRRRPRKRTDARLAELEREVQVMRSLLKKSKGDSITGEDQEEKPGGG